MAVAGVTDGWPVGDGDGGPDAETDEAGEDAGGALAGGVALPQATTIDAASAANPTRRKDIGPHRR